MKLGSKSEENLFYHPIFIFVLLIIYRHLNTTSRISLLFIAALSLLLASLHIQPFLIICGSLFLYTISEGTKIKPHKTTNFQASSKALLAFAIPGLIYYFVIHYSFYNPMVVKAYANNIYSLFHNESIQLYLEAFLLFLQGHLFTGSFPVISMTLLRIEPTLLGLVLGIFLLFFILILLIKRTFFECVLLSALGFVFLYEPTISERWDTVLIALIICMFSWLSDTKHSSFIKHKSWLLIPCLTLIILGIYRLPDELSALKVAHGLQNEVCNEASRLPEEVVNPVFFFFFWLPTGGAR